MNMDDVVRRLFRRAYGFSKNAPYRFTFANAFFRSDEIAQALSWNIMMVVADTYYATIVQHDDENYAVMVGGTDEVVDLALYVKHNFAEFVRAVTGKPFHEGFEEMIKNPKKFNFVIAFARF